MCLLMALCSSWSSRAVPLLCVLQGAAAGEAYLLHAGHQLDASKTLADYSIQHQDTCELLLRLRCMCSTLQPTP